MADLNKLNMWSNIENFFDNLICKRENSHTKKI